MRVGAIDIGSNSVRLLVADVTGEHPGTLSTVARAGEPCRLASDLERTGEVRRELAEKAATLVASFANRARTMGAKSVLAGATAALRGASNGRWAADLIGERAGVDVHILSGDEEARLVYQSVVLGLGAIGQRNPCIVFDIGGGSTEVVSGVGGIAGRWVSLPLGAVNLTERFLSGDPPSAESIEALESHVASHLIQACALMPISAPLLAGVGGTVTVMGMLDQKMSSYDPGLLEGYLILSERADSLIHSILTSPHRERRSWPAMGEGRADIVVAGALVVRGLLRRFPSAGLVCSTQGLRYGLAREAARKGT
jgi:exopolyphosphatase/guanosine-5'-triphosphate,3'-diphosphate pyrophosphatase